MLVASGRRVHFSPYHCHSLSFQIYRYRIVESFCIVKAVPFASPVFITAFYARLPACARGSATSEVLRCCADGSPPVFAGTGSYGFGVIFVFQHYLTDWVDIKYVLHISCTPHRWRGTPVALREANLCSPLPIYFHSDDRFFLVQFLCFFFVVVVLVVFFLRCTVCTVSFSIIATRLTACVFEEWEGRAREREKQSENARK